MKRMTLLILLLAGCTTAYAMDEDIISVIHNKTRATMTDVCKKKMPELAAICPCIGDKAQENLNDDDLAKCQDGDNDCIKKAVEVATIMAMSIDSINACKSEMGLPADTTASNAQPTAPETPPPPPLSPNGQ